MRSHDECERDINEAMARGADGFAYYLAERCDREHGDLSERASR
jgi:hypothetical protein